MKKAPAATPCACGRGCKGTASASNPAIRSERDAVAIYLQLHGPMPVYADGAFEGLAPDVWPKPLYVIETIDDPRIEDKVPTARKARQEQAEADPVFKARHGEAMAWVAAYTGSWALILDIRADRRWGTKYMRLSERQVEVILNARDRDAQRSQVAQADPAQAEAREYLAGIPDADLLADARRGFAFESDMARQALTGRPFSERQLAAIQSCRSRRQARSASPAGAGVGEGMYRVDDVVYKVQKAVNGSGHLYAKRLAVYGPGSAAFEYEQGAIRKLRPEHRMTVEEAETFGKLYGVCAVCGRALTDEKSIERGIGPICAGRV